MTRGILTTALGLGIWLLGSVVGDGLAAQEDRPQDRAALRALRDTAVKAINARDFPTIATLVHPSFSIVTVDQQRFKSLPEFQAYWQALFQGANAPLRSLALRPETELTRFPSEDLALSDGTSADTYTFTDGDSRVMQVRWSAVSQKVDGQWKLATVHIGTNLFDNPVLHAATRTARKTTAGAAAGALVVGGFVGVWIGRRRSSRRR